MDFSRYGTPSASWVALAAANPGVTNDGHSGNDPLRAEELQTANNNARELIAEGLMSTTGLDAKVAIETLELPSRGQHIIPVRRYMSKNDQTTKLTGPRVLLFFHGGGMLFGSERTDDVLCSRIALDAGITVLSVVYRHTPQHHHPAQHDDAWDAFEYIRDISFDIGIDISHGIGIMGISAGGGLAAAVVHRDLTYARTMPGYKTIINGALLLMPWLIHIDNYPFELFEANDKTAKVQCQMAPVVPIERLRLFTEIFAPKQLNDPLLNIPLVSDSHLEEWPRTAILVAGMDPLRDDGLVLATKLKNLGVSTSTHIFPGVPHGFRKWTELPESKALDVRLLDCVLWAMQLKGHEGKKMEGWHENAEL